MGASLFPSKEISTVGSIVTHERPSHLFVYHYQKRNPDILDIFESSKLLIFFGNFINIPNRWFEGFELQ